MKRFAPACLIVLGVLALLIALRFAAPRDRVVAAQIVDSSPAAASRATPREPAAPEVWLPGPQVETVSTDRIPAPDKQANIARIQRDYEALRREVLARYGSEGEAFPGGSHTLLRQLALLERERRADLAAVLSPRELEELESHESAAGRRVEWQLRETPATDEQRRAVFRLQRAFDLHFAAAADSMSHSAPVAEQARARTQAQIRAVLGEPLFGAWLGTER